MKSALVLRTVLGRWWQLAGLLPFVIYVVVFGGAAAANGTAVWLMGIVGWIAGVFAKDLGNWPNRTLVPGYSKTLFHLVLVSLLLIPLACGLLWTALGNPPPPYGPGLLWGTIMTLCVVRTAVSPGVLSTNLVGIIGLGFYLIWAANQAMHPVVFELLTDWRLQLPALALAALALLHIRRRLNAPLRATTPIDAAGREPLYSKLFGLMAGPHAGFRREVVVSSPLVVLALVLVLLVRTGISTYPMWVVFMIACLVYGLVRVTVRLSAIHFAFRLLWVTGAAETRRSLGRKSALLILAFGLGWLPAGLAGVAILALGVHQTVQFDGVLLICFTILLTVALSVGTVRHIPSPTRRWWQLLVVGAFCGGVTTPLIHGFELGWADRLALVVILAGLAVATWYGVARALARAEIVQ